MSDEERLRNAMIYGTSHPEIYKTAQEEEIERLRAENEKLRRAMHDIYEVYAGSEGIPEPVGCAEAYLLKLLMDMVEIAAEHKRAAAAAIRETKAPSKNIG